MYCPRCGAENEAGDRFCSSCGGDLRRKATPSGERPSLPERLANVVGTTRRARLLTAGTVLALALAVVAFIVLPANEESVPRNDYVIAADHICVVSKEQVAAAGVKAANGQGPQSVERFGRQLVLIAAQWRAALASHGAPAAQIDQARALDVALRDVEVGAGVLTVAAERGQGDLVGLARKLDERTREVESAIADMGLSHCARLVLAPVAGASS